MFISYYWVLTTLRNVSSLKASAASATIDLAVEKFGLLDNPELLLHYWLSSSYFEKKFIWAKNA